MISLTKAAQSARRDSKSFVVVDEDCGIPTSIVESYRGYYDNGPLAQSDPRSLLLSMSEYDKSQGYENVYGKSGSHTCLVASVPGRRGSRGAALLVWHVKGSLGR